IPVRSGRSYSLAGWIKGGDVLNPSGTIPGAVLCVQFRDAEGQPLGEPVLSEAVEARTDWKQVSTPPTQPPAGAVTAELTAGMRFVQGSAYFDDLALNIQTVADRTVAHVHREQAGPTPGVTYAQNLLVNGDV